METQTIYLDEEDDLVSIKDRLNWAREQRVLFVLPNSGNLLTEQIDLILLRRHAGNLRTEIGLVTHDNRVKTIAREVGIPTFSSKQAGQKRRAWARVRPKQWQRQNNLHIDDRRELYRRMTPSPLWRRYLWRYCRHRPLFPHPRHNCLSAWVYTVPTATITLAPETKTVNANHLKLWLIPNWRVSILVVLRCRGDDYWSMWNGEQMWKQRG